MNTIYVMDGDERFLHIVPAGNRLYRLHVTVGTLDAYTYRRNNNIINNKTWYNLGNKKHDRASVINTIKNYGMSIPEMF